MDTYLYTSTSPYEVGKHAMAVASIGATGSLLILSAVGIVLIVSWGVSRVRQKANEETKTPDYAGVREAVYRASEQERARVEEAARQQ
ncbi:hypothetical protein SJ05684_c10310 [Sinorhizobium sojae CCBAU 05684]|uniref:Uncharacterized protein n=2 Tax=Sinorhizobium sojae TaxID=716925 RepID=A0A249PB29_9HYPH|nr:hypothetical protein SJ05684_c10310 [Sinorhizobium sojae CCBAU 05684]